ncbi:MAG: amidohydrolase family protein [Deferribacteres bacterium]|nr:amidohydrolase family protein [Deferribacteres bacterium]
MKIIDIHTHGAGGADTSAASADQILHMAEIHGSRGVSEIIPAVFPSTIGTMRKDMEAIKQAIERQMTGQQRGTSSRIAGIYLEGPFLNRSRCGALDPLSFLEPAEHTLRQLIEGFEDVVKIITIAPELPGAARLIRAVSGMGITVSMGHSDASYAEAEAGFHAGARGITHIFNAMRGIHHREPGIAGFGLMHRDVYIEVIADPFHLDPGVIELIFRVKNPDRIIIISDTVRESLTKPAHERITGERDKLSGGSMTVAESTAGLIRMGLDRDLVMKSISENPERYLRG